MAAEYHPLDDDSGGGASKNTSFNKMASTMPSFNVPEDHQPLLASNSINLLPQTRDSADAQSLITTINVREEYEQQHATATPFSCVINLANTILGTGMLAMVGFC